ncbi:MAG TPA: acetylxylan esterase [Verrucomicrobiota bacterium]|nr:acetylxylan esterase [Verrucomicrobiota bacterium]
MFTNPEPSMPRCVRRTVAAAIALITATVLTAHAAESAVRPPAPSLERPASAEKAPTADGFIQRWLILEPIRSNTTLTDNAVKETVRKEYFTNQFSFIPRDGDKVTVGPEELTWYAVDTKEYNVNLYHFAYALNRPTSFVLFWTVTIVSCPEEMRDVRLAIGSNAASVWWVNGQEVIGIYGDRQTVIDDGVSKRLTLKKGANIVRGAVINGGGATDFCARFLDADDKPLQGFTLNLGAVAR